MALEFPASPTDGQLYPAAPNSEYIYNTAKGAWMSLPTEAAKTVTSDTPPANPKDGDQWFKTSDGTFYIYVVDVDGGQWVESQAPITANGYYSPNYIINGGFDIWQRGTSATLATTGLTNYYTADRWATYNPTGTGALAQDTTNVPTGLRFGLRFTASAANSSCNFYHTIETANASQLAGKTVTLSFYASGTAGLTPQIALLSSTTTDASWTSSFTTVGSTTITATTTVTRYSLTAVVPINAKTLQVFVGSGNLANGNFLSFTGVQLEEGSVATTFRRNANSIQGELAACQRYYTRISGDGVYSVYATGTVSGYAGGTYAYFPIILPVTMRISPAGVETSAAATFLVSDGVNSATCTAAPSIATGNSSKNVAWITSTNNALTTYRTAFLQANNTSSSYIGFSAEL